MVRARVEKSGLPPDDPYWRLQSPQPCYLFFPRRGLICGVLSSLHTEPLPFVSCLTPDLSSSPPSHPYSSLYRFSGHSNPSSSQTDACSAMFPAIPALSTISPPLQLSPPTAALSSSC